MLASKNKLPRSTPEEQEVSSERINNFLDGIAQNNLELHSMMLVRRGHVVAEGWWAPYRADRPHMLFSLSKSFTSTGIGLAAQEGLLSVDDPVVSFFPEHQALIESNENLNRMRVRHLLSMSTGHAEDTTGKLRGQPEGDWVKAFLSLPVEYEPGTHFLYNSGASYMLSAIVQRVSGMTLFDYLKPRLFEPLGIEHPAWETCPKGISAGGWGLSIRTEDIANFGQFYLQKGVWEGKRILSEEWVDEATSRHISNGSDEASDWQQGYGYQFWRCRHGVYRGDGAFGQYCIVMPEQEAVLAITSGVNNMQAVLDLVWEHLLPAMGNETAALPSDADSTQQLQTKLRTLEIKPPEGNEQPAIAERVSGKTYQISFEQVKSAQLVFQFKADSTSITLRDDRGEHTISCGASEWVEGTTDIYGPKQRVCASGVWQDDSTFVVTLRFVETPFVETLVCKFHENQLRVESSVNVSFGPKERPVIEGTWS